MPVLHIELTDEEHKSFVLVSDAAGIKRSRFAHDAVVAAVIKAELKESKE